MLKIINLCLFLVIARFTEILALTDEEKIAIREGLNPLLIECLTAHGATQTDFQASKAIGYADGVKPCFVGCFMKKVGILNDKGMFAPVKGIERIKKYLKTEQSSTKLQNLAKECAKVNDAPVTDGERGCDRGNLIVACLLEQKADLPF